MADAIRFEKALISDLREIVEIENACFTYDKFSSRQFIYLLTKSKALFYKVLKDNKITGYIILLRPINAKNLRLYSIAVHPEARGKGIAELLMKKTIEIALKLGCSGVKLEVRIDNVKAINLYKKFGFIEKGIKTAYYTDGSNALIMAVDDITCLRQCSTH